MDILSNFQTLCTWMNATFLDDFQSLCRKQNFFQDHCSMVRKKLYLEKNMRYIGQEREKKVEKYCDDRKGGSTPKKILFLGVQAICAMCR